MALAPFLPTLMALLIAGGGQDAPAPDAADPPPTGIVALDTLADRLTVPVVIAGAGPYPFIIDTGAERTVISRELAGRLGLPVGREVNVVAMSGTSRVGTVVIPSLRLTDVAATGAIVAPALAASDLGAAGLLGIDTLQDHRVLIDFEAGTMALAPSGRRQHREPPKEGEILIRAKSVMGQLIVTDAAFDGRAVRVVVDTGSPVSIGNAALRRLVAREASDFRALDLTSATGGTVTTQYAQVDKLRIGGVEFRGLPIAFAEVAPFARFGLTKRPAMLLGMDALRFFRRVGIDFPNREVRFRLPRRDRMATR